VAIGCARGLDTKSTAAALGLSPKTVDELWRRVYKKFNCHSRVEILSRLLASALGRAGRKRPIGVPDPSGRNVAFQPLGSRLRAENKKRTSRA
jgi:hypothetical protein